MTTLNDLMNMRGRRALVTGAAGGLGRVIADTLAELGADLLLVDLPHVDWRGLDVDLRQRWGVDVQILGCDLEHEEDRNQMIARVKGDSSGLSCLVNNAALVGTSDLEGWAVPFERQSLATWRRAMEVNLTAPFHLSQAFAPELRAGPGGCIINIGSIYGECGPDWRLYEGTDMGNPAAYAASKGGLLQLTRWLAATLAPDIRVNAVSPGGIGANQPEAFVRRYCQKTAMGRMAHADDLRGAVAYLAGDAAQYVTGHNLAVNGGWNC